MIKSLVEEIKREYNEARQSAELNSDNCCFVCGESMAVKSADVAFLISGHFSRRDESSRGDGKTVINYTCAQCKRVICLEKARRSFHRAGLDDALRDREKKETLAEFLNRYGGVDVLGDDGDDDTASTRPTQRADMTRGGILRHDALERAIKVSKDLVGFLRADEHRDYRKNAKLQWHLRSFGYVVLEGCDLSGRLTSTDFGDAQVLSSLLEKRGQNSTAERLRKGSIVMSNPTVAEKDRFWIPVNPEHMSSVVSDSELYGRSKERRKLLGFPRNFSREPSSKTNVNAKPFQADVLFAKQAWLNFRDSVHSQYTRFLFAKHVPVSEPSAELDFKKRRLGAEESAEKAVSSLPSYVKDAMSEGNTGTPREFVHSVDKVQVSSASILFREPTDSPRPNPQEVHLDR